MASAATRAKAKARAAGKQPSEALCQTCLNKLDAGEIPLALDRLQPVGGQPQKAMVLGHLMLQHRTAKS